MSDHPEEGTQGSKERPLDSTEVNRRKQQPQPTRQLLSCTKCRERKVKCDRTKPCSACCVRGQPKDCHFIAEGGNYAPIQQSYELRNLRKENLRLKERLRACKIAIDNEDSDPTSPNSLLGERPNTAQKRRTARQKRFQGSEWQDSLYFGSPGLASIVTDFAAVNVTPVWASLAHLVPRGPDMYSSKNPPPYPFPTFFKATPEECIPQLLDCLPLRGELLQSLSAFERRVNVCSFPHVPIEISKGEVERFLSDARRNAQMYPDMLALLFAAMALGGQHSVCDRSGGQWEEGAMPVEMQKGDVYIAAAMQALRLASFMHKPSLLGIQALIMIGPYLTNSGRFLDAWTLFGTTIRLAQSIGLHRHPKYLDPTPPTQQECSVRQTLWWWMLHMDEEYSMTLGRPLGISGIGDCPPPQTLTTDRHMLRFGEFVNHFTVLARQILSSHRLTNAKIDEFTDSLQGLLDTMPELLQFNTSWISEENKMPEWPLSAMAATYYCKTHTYLILLNRQRIVQDSTESYFLNTKTTEPSLQSVNRTPVSHSSPTTSKNASLRGRALVLASSSDLLDAFLFFYMKIPAALISWTMGQQAFNACMLILLDAMEQKRVTPGAVKVEKAYIIFRELQGVHELAGLAVEKISCGLKELRDATQASTGVSGPRGQQGGDTEMQGVESKATHGPHTMYKDTVMNATGMLLLEDPGLQSFVSESFAPIKWNITGAEQTSPIQFKQEEWEQEQEQEQEALRDEARQRIEPLDSRSSDEDIHHFRSSGIMRGGRKSRNMRLALTTPALDDPQPPGVTAPTSPIHRHHHKVQTTTAEDRSHKRHPPHLRRAQLRNASSHGWNYRPSASAFDTTQTNYPAISSGMQQLPATQLRHNTCPTIAHQSASAPSLLRSTYTSPSALDATHPRAISRHPSRQIDISDRPQFHAFVEAVSQSPNPAEHSSAHPPWAARASSRAALNSSAMIASNQAFPGLSQAPGQQQRDAYPLPVQFSQATPSTMSLATEQMTVDGWRRWIGSSKAG